VVSCLGSLGWIMNRRGFTMIELLVSLAVIGLLVAIIAPAIMNVRESARRMECQNNLRQIGLATLEYESEFGVLPNGLLHRVTILPYLDLKGIYDLYDPSAPDEAPFQRIRNTVIPRYLCPSDPARRSNGVETFTSYPNCSGSGVLVNGADGAFGTWGRRPTNGLPVMQPIRIGDITDGTSNVAAVGEWLYDSANRPRLRTTWTTPRQYTETEVDSFRNTCELLPASPVDFGWSGTPRRGAPWYNGWFGTGAYNHMLPPNRPSCSNAGGVVTGIYTAGSLHRGGANLVYVDGHVRFESENIDRLVWQRIGSRNDDAANSP